MKKILPLIICVVLSVGLISCSTETADNREATTVEVIEKLYNMPNDELVYMYATENAPTQEEMIEGFNTFFDEKLATSLLESFTRASSPAINFYMDAYMHEYSTATKEVTTSVSETEENKIMYEAVLVLTKGDLEKEITASGAVQFDEEGKVDYISQSLSDSIDEFITFE